MYCTSKNHMKRQLKRVTCDITCPCISYHFLTLHCMDTYTRDSKGVNFFYNQCRVPQPAWHFYTELPGTARFRFLFNGDQPGEEKQPDIIRRSTRITCHQDTWLAAWAPGTQLIDSHSTWLIASLSSHDPSQATKPNAMPWFASRDQML